MLRAQVQSDIEQRARQSAAAEDTHAAAARAAKQAQRELSAAAVERSLTDIPSSSAAGTYSGGGGSFSAAAGSNDFGSRHQSPRKKDRKNWSPSRREVRFHAQAFLSVAFPEDAIFVSCAAFTLLCCLLAPSQLTPGLWTLSMRSGITRTQC
jgi:hypothetical protein